MNYVSLRSMANFFLKHHKKMIILFLVVIFISLGYAHFTIPETKEIVLSESDKLKLELNELYKSKLSDPKDILEIYPELATEETWETIIELFLVPSVPEESGPLTSLYHGLTISSDHLFEFNKLADYDYSQSQYQRLWKLETNPESMTLKIKSYGATKEASAFLADIVKETVNKRNKDSAIPHNLIEVDKNTSTFNQLGRYEAARDDIKKDEKRNKDLLFPESKSETNSSSQNITIHYLKYLLVGVFSGLAISFTFMLFKSTGNPKFFSLKELKYYGLPIVGAYRESANKLGLQNRIMIDIPIMEKEVLVDHALILTQRNFDHKPTSITTLYDPQVEMEFWSERAKNLSIELNLISLEKVNDISVELIKSEPLLIISKIDILANLGEHYLSILTPGSLFVVAL